MANTVVLKAEVSKLQKELIAAEAITPGMLVERNSDGKVQKHSTAGGNSLPMFPKEDALQGKGIDEDYESDDPVQVWYPGRGDEVYAILADGENVNEGDFLESNGAGYLQAYSSDSAASSQNPIVGVAKENLNLTSSSGGESSNIDYVGTNARIKIEVA